jgi:WD40 repeat protein
VSAIVPTVEVDADRKIIVQVVLDIPGAVPPGKPTQPAGSGWSWQVVYNLVAVALVGGLILWWLHALSNVFDVVVPVFAFFVAVTAGTTKGDRFVSVSLRGETKVWAADSDGVRLLRTFEATPPAYSRAVISPDGELVVLAAGKRVAVREVKTGEQKHQLECPDEVSALGVSADSRMLAAGTARGDVLLWEFASGKSLGTLKARGDRIGKLSFAPRGNRLATVDAREVRLWDAPSAHELARFGSALPPLSLSFSADGNLLAVGFGGPRGPGLVRLWDVGELLRRE